MIQEILGEIVEMEQRDLAVDHKKHFGTVLIFLLANNKTQAFDVLYTLV